MSSLPDIAFENNLGSLVFRRALLSISEEWSWGEGASRKQCRYTVQAKVHRDDAFLLESIASTDEAGGPGKLTLPWKVIKEGIKLVSAQTPVRAWVDWVDVEAEFLDDTPVAGRHTLDFFGLELHNPHISFSVPSRTVKDDFVQMPLDFFGGAVDSSNPIMGPIRKLLTHDNMQVVLVGTWMPKRADPGLLDLHSGANEIDIHEIINRASRRVDTDHVDPHSNMPRGYPDVFGVADFSEDLANALPLKHLWVSSSSLAWQVKTGAIKISITMECPPQLLPDV